MKKMKLIFIVEDDEIYAKTLMHNIKLNLNQEVELKWFPVGEVAEEQMSLNPDFVIIDYNLNSKYFDAENGLKMAINMRNKSKNTKFILLSSQLSIEIAVEAVKKEGFQYVIKNNEAFSKVLALLK